MKSSILSLVVLVLASPAALADPSGHPPVAMPKEFDTLKGLVGEWEGTTMMEGKKEEVKVVYELTSGGTAITEKLNAGSPNEMISVYHKDGKSLAMTHYCAMGNAPQMKLKKAEEGKMAFEMKGAAGISSTKEHHMHAVTLMMPDKDTLTQEWVSYENGKKKEVAVFTFKRD